MSEYYREQHPLLCEEVSEEEHYSPRYHRQLRPTTYRGRARNNLKGAASIITRWPDHWFSFLVYLWIGLGMISLTTFIVYNSLFAFSMLPSAKMKPTGIIISDAKDKTSQKLSSLPDVYMHIFTRQNEEVDFNQHIPNIEAISNKYPNFKYHVIVVVNDTNLDWLSPEENNKLALNSLWSKELKKEVTTKPNIAVEYITLSAYMDNSPLKKYWKTLPHQLIEFLTRAISIWDKGGITFNPNILAPKPQHTLYNEKLHKLLSKYASSNKVFSDYKIINKMNKTPKKERRLNNIQDIINALENEDNPVNVLSQQTLTEAENIKSPVYTRNERHIFSVTETPAKITTEPLKHIQHHSRINSYLNKDPILSLLNSDTETTSPLDNSRNATKLSLLPLFLEFLFHNKLSVNPNPTETPIVNRTRRHVIEIPKADDTSNSLTTHPLDIPAKRVVDSYKPVIVSAAGIYNKTDNTKHITEKSSKETDDSLEKNRLTIDLKGNIIATDTPCHAFLGTVFSNAVHHSQEESVTDFIIAELTIFCKGLLSSCTGIDLILL
ncbi:unnamed protein product [Chrysodeixis includens]|uniref:Uncharacterized protein n=1 Tax=Chrysodeixis includens TaxID=689277 RepID=A0A9P0BJR5_CHRIL|nr:unnamed protein product [Chrysodeixis includens]